MNVYPSFPWNVAMLLPNCLGSQTVQSGVILLPKLSSALDCYSPWGEVESIRISAP